MQGNPQSCTWAVRFEIDASRSDVIFSQNDARRRDIIESLGPQMCLADLDGNLIRFSFYHLPERFDLRKRFIAWPRSVFCLQVETSAWVLRAIGGNPHEKYTSKLSQKTKRAIICSSKSQGLMSSYQLLVQF